MESDQAELLLSIATFLDASRIPYMITGAWSVIFYGRPRASHDIDFVVELYEKDIDRVMTAVKKLPMEFFVNEAEVKRAIRQQDVFQMLHRPTFLKLDFWLLTRDRFDTSRFRRRQIVQILGKRSAITSKEDTILQKLRWYKQAQIEKHLVDAAFVYQIQQKELDKRYLRKWAKELGVLQFLDTLKTIDLTVYM